MRLPFINRGKIINKTKNLSHVLYDFCLDKCILRFWFIFTDFEVFSLGFTS